MTAYKFLAEDGTGRFSRFAWPLPSGRLRRRPGDWVEAEVDPCRSGVHACRVMDLPYWIAPALYEIELDGEVRAEPIKVIAPRGRLVRRVRGWNDRTRTEYARRCIERMEAFAAGEPRLAEWAPVTRARARRCSASSPPASAEELGGTGAYVEERGRQSAWLADLLDLA